MATPPPQSTKTSLAQRLRAHAHAHWPQLADVHVRYRGTFAYIDAQTATGETIPLMRLRYTGSATYWGFALHLPSANGYQDSLLPNGTPIGTPQEALDCACTLHLADPDHSWAETV